VIHEITNESADAFMLYGAKVVRCECGFESEPVRFFIHLTYAESSGFDYEAGWVAYYNLADRRNKAGLTYSEWVASVEAGF
jgi:hypothetical protein